MRLRTATIAGAGRGVQCLPVVHGLARRMVKACRKSSGQRDRGLFRPLEQGINSAGLARLIETVGTYKQDSLTIIRNGRIVADAYYAPYVAGISHDLRSVTKSVVGTLTAIQLQKGSLDSVDHPVVDLFSDKEIGNADDRKKAMTVQDLLDMTSGMEWWSGFIRPTRR